MPHFNFRLVFTFVYIQRQWDMIHEAWLLELMELDWQRDLKTAQVAWCFIQRHLGAGLGVLTVNLIAKNLRRFQKQMYILNYHNGENKSWSG